MSGNKRNKGGTAIFVFKHPLTGEYVRVEGRGRRIARARALLAMKLKPEEFDLVPEEPIDKIGVCSSGKLKSPREPIGRPIINESRQEVDVTPSFSWGGFA